MGIRRWIVRLIGTTLGIASLGMGSVALGYTLGIHPALQLAFRIFGWTLISISLLAVGAAITLYVQEHTNSPLYTWYIKKLNDVSIREGVVNDVPHLVAIANTFIEGGVSANFVDRLMARPETATIIEDKTKNGSVVGFYILLPLSAAATQDILDGSIRSGTQLTASCFTQSPRGASSIYVGSLWGSDVRSRAIAVFSLYMNIVNLMFQGRNIQYLFAKPSTKGSVGLKRRFPMKPIFRDNEIWQVSRQEAIRGGLVQPRAIRVASRVSSNKQKA